MSITSEWHPTPQLLFSRADGVNTHAGSQFSIDAEMSEVVIKDGDTEATQTQCDFHHWKNETEAKIDQAASRMAATSMYDERQHSVTIPILPDCFTTVTVVPNQGLPNEIFEEIFTYLDLPSMLRCRGACSAFRELIDSFPYFHWKRELAISGMEDGENFPLATRRQMLEQHQKGWANLHLANEQRKHILGPWGLNGNLFAQCEPDRTVIYFDQLECPSRNIKGRHFTVDIRTLRAFMFSFEMDPAQDLLAILCFAQQDNNTRRIFLLTLSTGEPHPLASLAGVLIHTSMHRQWNQHTYICGENLCIVLDDSTGSEIKVWNWKTGQVVANIVSDRVQSLTFLSERYIIFTIEQEPSLIVIDFITKSGEKRRLSDVTNTYSFRFPPLVEAAELPCICVKSNPAPNWKPHSASSAPFFTSRHDRVYDIRLYVHGAGDNEQQVQIIALGSAFLSVIEGAASLNTTCFDWPSWGPDGTRMLVSAFGHVGICGAYGMKFLSTHTPAEQPADHVYIYDFNQSALRWSENHGNSAAEWSTHDGKGEESIGYINVTEPTKIAPGEIFQDEVVTRLGYRVNRWAIPGQPRVEWTICREDGIALWYDYGDEEEIHMFTL